MMLVHPTDSRIIPNVKADVMKKLLAIRRQLFKEMFYQTSDTAEQGYKMMCKIIQMQ